MKFILKTAFFSLIALLVLGIPTALMPTRFFSRMVEAEALDYFFWGLNAVLLGILLTLLLDRKTKVTFRDEGVGIGGYILSVFAVGCPVCNGLVVSLLGASGALLYFNPIRPLLGLVSFFLLSGAIGLQLKFRRECLSCLKQ